MAEEDGQPKKVREPDCSSVPGRGQEELHLRVPAKRWMAIGSSVMAHDVSSLSARLSLLLAIHCSISPLSTGSQRAWNPWQMVNTMPLSWEPA